MATALLYRWCPDNAAIAIDIDIVFIAEYIIKDTVFIAKYIVIDTVFIAKYIIRDTVFYSKIYS